jgi:hypothetical protein
VIGEHDTDRVLRTWAADGVDRLPDRLFDAVRADVARLPQRRSWLPAGFLVDRPWLRLAVVAGLLLLVVALAAVAGGLTTPRLLPFRGGDVRLEPGRYVLDAPFDFHLSLDVPEGWLGVEMEAGVASLVYDVPARQPEIMFATVRGLPLDPCRSELGLREPLLQPGVDDLVRGLAALPGLGPAAIRETTIGGRQAWILSVVGGSGPVTCASGEAFTLWSLGEPYSLEDGARHRVWMAEVDGGRLVIAARDFGPDTAAARDIDAMIASLRLGSDAPVRPSQPRESDPVDVEPTLPPLPSDGLIAGRDLGYIATFPVYAFGEDGTSKLLTGQHYWVMPVYGDWQRSSHGMVADAGPDPAASLRIWSVGRVYLDPCHWKTSAILQTAERVGEYEALARAFSAWWGPDPDETLAGASYEPPPLSPVARPPRLHAWPGNWARHIDLEVPDGFDLARCDDGEYRIWEDQDGSSSRSAQPGERILLRVAQLDDSVVVLEAGYQTDASDQLRTDMTKMLDESFLSPMP